MTLSTLPVLAFVLAWLSARMQVDIGTLEKDSGAADEVVADTILAIDTMMCYSGHNDETWTVQNPRWMSLASSASLVYKRLQGQ